MAKIDDNLNITINIRWLVQIIVLIGIIVGTWYQAQMKMAENHRHIKLLQEQMSDVQSRIGGMEREKVEDLEEEKVIELYEKAGTFSQTSMKQVILAIVTQMGKVIGPKIKTWSKKSRFHHVLIIL